MEDDYIVRKYSTVTLSSGKVQKKFLRHVSSMFDFVQEFATFCNRQITENRLYDTVFVDRVVYQYESTASVLEMLKSHLFQNIIKVSWLFISRILSVTG